MSTIGFMGCGAKKKAIQKEARTQKNDIFVQETEISTIDLNKIINQLIVEPVDPKVPNDVTFISGKDTVTIKSSNSRVLRKTEKVDSIAENRKHKDVEDKSQIAIRNIDKNIESEGWNWKGLNWFLLLIIILLGIFVYYKLQKK